MMALLSQNQASLSSVKSIADHDLGKKRSAELGLSHGPSSNPGMLHRDTEKHGKRNLLAPSSGSPVAFSVGTLKKLKFEKIPPSCPSGWHSATRPLASCLVSLGVQCGSRGFRISLISGPLGLELADGGVRGFMPGQGTARRTLTVSNRC